MCYIIIITFVVTTLCGNKLSNIIKYIIKTSKITQVTLLTNVMCYLSNKVIVTSLIQITKSLISLVIH